MCTMVHVVMRLQTLDTETWGERVARARTRSGVSLKEAAARVSQFEQVSYTSLMRLERLGSVPSDGRRRIIAYLALVSYGYDPEDFGLSANALPRWMTGEALTGLRMTDAGEAATLTDERSGSSVGRARA